MVNPPDIKTERFTKKQSLAKPDRPQQINRAQRSRRLRQRESTKPCAGRIKTSSGVDGRWREMGEYRGEQRLLLPGSEVFLICYPPQKAVIVDIYPVWSRATTKRMDSARARIIVWYSNFTWTMTRELQRHYHCKHVPLFITRTTGEKVNDLHGKVGWFVWWCWKSAASLHPWFGLQWITGQMSDVLFNLHTKIWKISAFYMINSDNDVFDKMCHVAMWQSNHCFCQSSKGRFEC